MEMYVFMQGTVSDKWSSLERQPLSWGLFTWNCMYWLVLGFQMLSTAQA